MGRILRTLGHASTSDWNLMKSAQRISWAIRLLELSRGLANEFPMRAELPCPGAPGRALPVRFALPAASDCARAAARRKLAKRAG
jgi:hypothetical protein